MSYFAVMLASIPPTQESIPPTPLRKGGYSVSPLSKGGYSVSPLSKGGQGGYLDATLRAPNTESSSPFHQESIPPTPLRKGGYNAESFVDDRDKADATQRDRNPESSSSSPLSKGGQGGYLGLDPNTDWLPILIRMRDLARHPDKSILEYVRIFAEKTMAVKTLPTGFFEHWLEDGRALILLDGLDEVAEEGKRYDVVRRIENFLGQFDRNRAIITSRPAGYRRDFFRTAEFPHYQMQSFDDEKISAFINNWYDSRFKDKTEAERRKESLQKALDDNDRIKLLARNPLLLTIIALIHRYQAVLPKERHRLYDKAVETLLISWDANKELSSHGRLQYLGLDDVRRLMELLAYWVHTQGNVGSGEGGTLIDKDELIEQLSREIKDLKQVQLYQSKEEAERFVDLIRERTGLLNEQGQDCYAFVHKTFQEYLCAEEIDYQLENEFDFGIILNAIREYLHDAHWREVLLLLIAQQKPKNAAKAIRAVLNNGSEYEEWLHRDLFFAGSCLVENPKGLRGVDGELVQEILEKLVELEVNSEEQVGEKVRDQVHEILCSLYETDFDVQALEMLKGQSNLIDELRLFQYQAELGGEDEVIAILLARLQDENLYVRKRAIADAFKVGKSSEALVNVLLTRLQDDDYYIRWRSIIVLGKLGNSSETVVTTLLARLQDEDYSVRSWAVSALAQLGNASETVVSALLARLRDEDYSVRGWAASALAQLGKLQKNSETVVTALLALLQDGDSDVHWIAAIALSYLGQSSETVVTTLLRLLQNENSDVQGWAASALGKLGNSSETVISALLALLQNENSSPRWQIATALGRLGNSSETVISALLALLQDEDSDVRRNATSALGKLNNSSETLVNALVARLEDKDYFVCHRAAEALGKLGKKSDNILPTIVQWIQQHQDSEYVGRGVDALWYLVVGEES
ncbi:MAG: signal transduction protein [Okeania sp. SIO3I5]|nr:signal transduction protein [Okeania sp. SIO3I5]